MKEWRTYTSCAMIVLCLAAIGSLAGCATTHMASAINSHQPNYYKQYQEQEGLVIAVQPIVNKEEMLTYFDDNLLRKGILPILIVAENKNTTQAYLITPEQILLKSAPSQDTNPSPSGVDTMSSADTRKTTYEKSYEGIGVAVWGGPLFLPFAFLDWGPTEHSKAVQHNIASKALRKKTLAPNQQQSGCIYLTLPENASAATTTLVVTSTRIAGDSPLRFEFPLNIPIKSSREVTK